MTLELPKAGISAQIVLASQLHASRVIWDGDPWPHAGPITSAIAGVPKITGILTLNLTTDTQTGVDEDVRTFVPGGPGTGDDALQTESVSRSRVVIQATLVEFGTREAFDICARIRRHIQRPLMRSAFRTMGLAVAKAPKVTNLGYVIDGKTHAQAVLEMFFNRMVHEDITEEYGLADGTDGFIESAIPLTGTYLK